MPQTTENSRMIKATAETIYNAFTEPKALETWLAPGKMKGKVHDFDFKVGGGYKISLFYPSSEKESKGKTKDNEDRFEVKFIEIIPNLKIVQAVNFDSSDPDYLGEMTMEVTFTPINGSTKVTFLFKNIPHGIKPEDNEAGTLSSLEKLAKYVE
ncbi:SRPBCC family protein [Echinicola jeungdonensis]|uniref:SRPBCC family protein n=1 Tax=Echinicola jeungdonensis TaxID=709343 RepID=A0ABV5J2W5_9BACT|nr:SRPBCC family protein [Echinicola jeungdonensis]MDN3667990.1 SRPBCC family protein [Echinicola jeungdonensis]